MIFKLKLLFIFLIYTSLAIFFPHSAFADTFTLSGNISDSVGNNIENATITVADSTTGTNAGSTTSDSAGNYNLVLLDGVYNVQVTPPAGSSFSQAIAYNRSIANNAVLNFFLTPAGTVSLKGKVLDPLGNPLSGQIVNLSILGGSQVASSTTASNGEYSMQVSAGTYVLAITANDNNLNLNVAQNYQLRAIHYDLNQSTLLDIVVPSKKVDIHVQDSNGTAVSGVRLSESASCFMANSGTIALGGGITNATGFNTYNSPSGPLTDSSGNVTLWLLPNSPDCTYTLTATPPSESTFVTTTLRSVSITTDSHKTIKLEQPLTLSGHVYDPQGNPVQGQTVLLRSSNGNVISTTTDVQGNYSLQNSSGVYDFVVSAQNNSLSLKVPQRYDVTVNNFSFTKNLTLDVTLPTKKVNIHVTDAFGAPISNVRLSNTSSCFLANTGTLTIGGGITSATGFNTYSSTDGPTTDESGNVALWLLPNSPDCKYTFTATPPSGSSYTLKTVPGISVTTDKELDITLQQPVTFAGKVLDSQGNALSGQVVNLSILGGEEIASSTTNSYGEYSMNISTGTYVLAITANNNSLQLHVPQNYQLRKINYNITQNTTLDITVPAKKVDIHVQDAFNNPISDTKISNTASCFLANTGTLSISQGITDATGFNTYNASSGPITNAFGDVTLWLIPNSNDCTYRFLANPPSGSPYSQFSLNNISVTEDQTELISLQYNHDTPVTSADLATQHPDETYSNPTTVTLTASAAPGYTIANTYYTIDGGSQQTYSSPFTISNSGNNTITYWSIDNTGVQETHKTKTFTIATAPTSTPTPTPTTVKLTSLNPAKIWIGLKNSDDIGIKFDLKAEVYKNNTLITSGQINSISAGSSGFTHARLNTIPFNTFSPINFPSGSKLSIKIYARNACNGSGKNSGTARLWYNDSQANSKFTATISTNTSNYFLLKNSALSTSTGTGPKLTSDLSAGSKCSPFKSFGTWTIIAP